MTSRSIIGTAAVLVAACGTEPDSATQPEASPSPGVMTAPPRDDVPASEPRPVDIGDEPLAHAESSMAALGEAIVVALNEQDEAALIALSVDQQEFTQRLFPALVSHPNMLRLGSEFAWTNQDRENRGDRARALREHGGKGYAFVALEPTASEPRPGLVVYRKPDLRVRDAEGNELQLRILGVVIEHPASGTLSILNFRG
ncbi:MAG: hypothetical protein AB1Z98_40155 [Nannocystaceae bacterium]